MKSYLTLIFLVLAIFATSAKAASYSVEAGKIIGTAPKASSPVWGKMVVVGNTVTCYYGRGTAAPTTWTKLGVTKTIGFLNNPLLVGLCIVSHDNTNIATGKVDNFSITPKPTYRLQDGDVGSPNLMGSANLINGVWNLAGSGADIWGTSDQFNFQPWLVWGDFTVVCRITGISSINQYAKIGIMVRDGYNSGSDYAMLAATNGFGTAFSYRPEFNVNPDGATIATLVAPATTIAGTAVGVNPIGSFSTFYTLRP